MSVCVQRFKIKSDIVATSGTLSWLRECVIAWNVRSAARGTSWDLVRTATARISSRSRRTLMTSGCFTALVSRHQTGADGVVTNSRPTRSPEQHMFGVTDHQKRSFDDHGNRHKDERPPRGRPSKAKRSDKPMPQLPRGLAARMVRRSCRHRSMALSIPSDADTSPARRDDGSSDCSGNPDMPRRAD